MDNRRIARSLVRIARDIIAEDGVMSIPLPHPVPEMPEDEEAMRASALSAKLDALHEQMQDALAERIEEFNQAKAVMDAAENKMKASLKEFNAKTGWNKMMKEATDEINEFVKAGGHVKNISTKFKVASKMSTQPAYKVWLEWAMAELKNDLLQSYLNSVNVFKKNTVEIKTGLAMADEKLNEWDERVVELYERNGISKKLPKASVRKAGFIGDAIQGVKSLFGKVFGGFMGFVSKLVASLAANAGDCAELSSRMEELDREFGRM